MFARSIWCIECRVGSFLPAMRCCFCFFFFSSRRRHTRCLSDWSSDVCSSDLLVLQQRKIDLVVAHVAVPGGLPLLDLGALEAKGLLVEVGGFFDVFHAKRDVPDACGHLGRCFCRRFCSHWIASILTLGLGRLVLRQFARLAAQEP